MVDIGNVYGRDLRLTQFEYARATLSAGSFTAAAKQCHVSQPALSSGIAALEATLGVQLFERSTTGAVATPAGQRLLPIMEAILGSANELVAVSRQLAGNRPLVRLGVSPLVSPALIADTFAAFRSAARSLEIAFSEANLKQLSRELTDGRLDVILIPKVQSVLLGATAVTVASEALHHVSAQREATPASVHLADLVERTLVVVTEDCGLTDVTRDVLDAVGAELKAHDARATSYQRLVEWADLGLGDALLPESKIPPGRASSVLLNRGQTITIEFEAVWYSSTLAHEIIALAVNALTRDDAITG